MNTPTSNTFIALNLRAVELNDIPRLEELLYEIAEVFNFSNQGWRLDTETVRSICERSINSKEHMCYILEEGENIAGLIYGGIIEVPWIVTPVGRLKKAEVAIWFVREKYRGSIYSIKLFQKFEKWCLSRGAQMITVAVPHTIPEGVSESLPKFLHLARYQPLEDIYCKHIGG